MVRDREPETPRMRLTLGVAKIPPTGQLTSVSPVFLDTGTVVSRWRLWEKQLKLIAQPDPKCLRIAIFDVISGYQQACWLLSLPVEAFGCSRKA
jgi:hypothetical protein